jgi:cysteinyl-tRNA synthetase
MEWDSPWGIGFPGWHIECSAMSMKYLGESFDVHIGGEDLRQTHHPNEIAQSEAATGKPFVKYWLHGAFLKVEGKRMAKSLGNFLTVEDIEKKGIDPLALRYLYLTANYKDTLNFTWDSLEASQRALNKLKDQVLSLRNQKERTTLSKEKDEKINRFREEFTEAVFDDLNTPQAIAVVWKTLKSNIPSTDKYDLLMMFDEALGFKLNDIKEHQVEIPEDVQKLLDKRNSLRKEEKFEESDRVREEMEKKGYVIEDTPEGSKLKKK